ncbi:hypothetical protein GTW25_10350 [Aliihoeflea aestuarii]|jgi:uncharacterized tellurite resistance protein B-like protein|uniref:tellurite resistance TerB family protein n=1 Tax=Aliihoeflea aestuarii TaxID=453840 RepID=UPI002091FEB1|nr:TerB family tellurite resistance protein [Aliihoeflea aestuarii]MCO6391430.1 hypothetical protein [Aliihoeflea aestuarii]
MLDRLLSLFRDVPASGGNADRSDDPRVAVAALMYHIIDADGVRGADEAKKLRRTVAEAYALSGSELDDVLIAGETAERDAVDFYAFTSVINRRLDHPAKQELISLLWEMVYADGERHELEDNIVWRVSELIGIDPQDRVALRRRVAERLRNEDNEGGD